MIFKALSVLCYIFAIVDLALFYIFKVDITGMAYSPVIAGVVGGIFGWIGRKVDGDVEVGE